MLKRVRFVTLFILSIFYVLDGYLAILHFSNITHKFSQEDQAFVDVYFNWKAASNYHHNSEEGIFDPYSFFSACESSSECPLLSCSFNPSSLSGWGRSDINFARAELINDFSDPKNIEFTPSLILFYAPKNSPPSKTS